MKKAIKTTVIALAGLLTVCACNERSSLPSKTESAKDQLISRLERYNANLVQQNSPQTKSPNWRNLTVVALANDYVDMISESDALTEEEKSEVYSAISVAVYSTCFWSNCFCTQPES